MRTELNSAALDRHITGNYGEDYWAQRANQQFDADAEASAYNDRNATAHCLANGLCLECFGEGRFFNPFGTGDAAGGLADTCDACKGTGKALPAPGTCPFCFSPSHIRMCPELRAAMGDDAQIDVPSLIESLDDARELIEMLQEV